MINYQLNKFGSFLSSFSEYGQISLAELNINLISFPFMLSDILTETKLLIRYPLVRYQFNLLKADGFHSDYKKLKILLKYLLLNAFHSSDKLKDAVVNINVECDGTQSRIEVWNSGKMPIKDFSRHFLSESYIQGEPISGINIIKTAVEKLQGDFSISTTPATGSIITVVLPDLFN